MGRHLLADQQNLPDNTLNDLDEEVAVFPLSFAQQRLWFLDQFEPGNPSYNILDSIRMVGPLDVAALEQSLNEIIRRHEVLRTTFATLDEQPVQVVARAMTLKLPVIELNGLGETKQKSEIQRLAIEATRTSFNLSHGPLIRATLLRLGDAEHVFLLTMHHIATDAWSIGILKRELATLYDAFSDGIRPSLKELPIQYADFALWQREWLSGEILESQLSYWKQQLSDCPVLQLPTDRPRPLVQTFRGARESMMLPKPLSKGLKALGQEEGVTLFMTLLAAFQTLLYRYTGQTDFAIGSPIANRTQTEFEALIGFFVNTLPLRTYLSDDLNFRELLDRVRKVCLDAYAHQDVPFEKLVEELSLERDMSHTPFFQVMFTLQNVPMETMKLTNLTLTPFSVNSGTAKFDLTLLMMDGSNGLSTVLEYNTDLFDTTSIQQMLRNFRTFTPGYRHQS